MTIICTIISKRDDITNDFKEKLKGLLFFYSYDCCTLYLMVIIIASFNQSSPTKISVW